MLSKYLIYHTYWGENKQQEKIKQITGQGKHLIYPTYWEEDKQTNKNKTLPEAQRTSSYPKQVHFTCFDTIWPLSLSSPCWTSRFFVIDHCPADGTRHTPGKQELILRISDLKRWVSHLANHSRRQAEWATCKSWHPGYISLRDGDEEMRRWGDEEMRRWDEDKMMKNLVASSIICVADWAPCLRFVLLHQAAAQPADDGQVLVQPVPLPSPGRQLPPTPWTKILAETNKQTNLQIPGCHGVHNKQDEASDQVQGHQGAADKLPDLLVPQVLQIRDNAIDRWKGWWASAPPSAPPNRVPCWAFSKGCQRPWWPRPQGSSRKSRKGRIRLKLVYFAAKNCLRGNDSPKVNPKARSQDDVDALDTSAQLKPQDFQSE